MTATTQTTQLSTLTKTMPPGTNHNQIVWLNRKPFQNSGVTLQSLTAGAHLLALPTTDTDRTTGQWIVSPLLNLVSLRRLIVAVGHATSAISQSLTMRVFSLKEMIQNEAPNLNQTSDIPQAIEYLREPMLELALSTSATAQAVNPASQLIRDPAGILTDIRFVDAITVSNDYTLRAQTANMQMRAGVGLTLNQLWDGDGSMQVALAIKAPASCGCWVGLGGL